MLAARGPSPSNRRILNFEGVFRVNQINRIARGIVWSPVLWGALATFGFYAPIYAGHWAQPFVLRYFAGHWVECATTALFFVGLAELLLKTLRIFAQGKILRAPLLDAIPAGGQSVGHCESLLERLARQPEEWQDSYLLRRLREALEFVYRKNSAAGLDDELRYLSDLDAGRMQSSYALVWFVIWAVPIMGFLGTIMGITNAVGNLSPKALEDSLSGVTSGLGVAFDTTALSLSLSIVLMFVKYFVERSDNRLLSQVDDRTNAELTGRFEDSAASADPQVASVRRIAETVLAALDKLMVRQTELWHESITAAQLQWSEQTIATGRAIETALTDALAANVREHAAALGAAEQAIAEQNYRHWDGVQQALVQNAEAIRLEQHELARQAELFGQIVGATEQVAGLERELNRNLAALAGAKHFEETVISLSAAIGLLSARLGAPETARVELTPMKRKGQAA
jgi:MotA/TolQ/ExbB proton channel family